MELFFQNKGANQRRGCAAILARLLMGKGNSYDDEEDDNDGNVTPIGRSAEPKRQARPKTWLPPSNARGIKVKPVTPMEGDQLRK